MGAAIRETEGRPRILEHLAQGLEVVVAVVEQGEHEQLAPVELESQLIVVGAPCGSTQFQVGLEPVLQALFEFRRVGG